MKADKSYLEWPFFEARHAQLERELDAWAAQHIAQEHAVDVDAACRQLVRQLGEGGWLRHAIGGTEHGGVGEAIDTRAICLIRETLGRYSGLADFAFAKRKAARQLGMEDAHCLPGNAEIESELRIHQGIYHGEEQASSLRQLRTEALATMRLLERFDPQLTGPVLDGTAGRYAETDVHLFADSDKEVEIFLLSNKIPYQTGERFYHHGSERRKVPVFTLDGPSGPIRLSVFAPEDARVQPRSNVQGGLSRARAAHVAALLEENHG